MKIKPKHYAYLKAKLAPFAGEIEKRRAAIIQEGRAKDVEKRLRWDLMYAAGLTGWLCDEIYKYADDTHFDTALRKAMSEIASPAGTKSTIVPTAGGDCTVFFNEVAHARADDPYLEQVGWYFQSLEYDDGPRGPYDTSEEAGEGAKAMYGTPEPADQQADPAAIRMRG